MGRSCKSTRPAPLDIAAAKSAAKSAERQYSMDSAMSEKDRSTSYSSEYSIPDMSPTHHRKDSSGSSRSSSSSKKVVSPTVNVYTHCGRHSDQYLFKGWGDMVRGMVKRE